MFVGLVVNIEWRGTDRVELYLDGPWFYHWSEQFECNGNGSGELYVNGDGHQWLYEHGGGLCGQQYHAPKPHGIFGRLGEL